MPLSFIVPGTPQQRGSKKAVVSKSTGKAIAIDMNQKKSKPWMSLVKDCAWLAIREQGWVMTEKQPIRLTAQYHFARPKSHYGRGRHSSTVKPSAPVLFHANPPDLSKLTRCLEDALTGIVWDDDSRVAAYGDGYGKFWTTDEPYTKVLVEVIQEKLPDA